MAVPYTFGSATSSIPLSQLDSNFATAITLGNTAVYLGNTTTTLNALTLSNVTISSGNVTITNVSTTNVTATLANVTTANVTNFISSNVSITGGTIDNVTIGGTTVGNVSANNVTISNNLTLSAGTANGVAYLNGSKVVTSGSALTFDGTTLTATQSSAAQISLNNASGNYLFLTGAGGAAYIDNRASSDLNFRGGGNFIWGVYGGSEQMRLTTTGLGIGTSSPATKLDVYNSAASGISEIARFRWNNGGSGGGITWANQAGTVLAQIANTSDASGNPLEFSVYNNSTALTKMMTLSGAGNLGLGVTPSAWGTLKALQVGYSSLGTLTSNTYLNNNTYYNGTNWIYSTTAPAGKYQINDNVHSWHIGASGTAGNAITFTQAMTLDASGNLGIGITSPSQRLSVDGNITSAAWIGRTNGSAPSADCAIYRAADNTLGFSTASTERARIDSSGNLLVGTTASAGNAGIQIIPNNGNCLQSIDHITGTATGNFYLTFNFNGSSIGSITQSGTTAVLYNITSDQRLKENIQDADSASSLIDSLQVRKFDWKADGNHQRYGFVAQELVTVAPEAVHQPINEEDMMAVDYSKLVPMLVKEIQSLRKRLADAGI
jgi:hypothetical protein